MSAYTMLRRVYIRMDDMVVQWRRTVTAADRGWKASALGLAIVLLTVFVF